MRRISNVARAFGLAAILGVSLVEHKLGESSGVLLALCALAAAAIALDGQSPLHPVVPVLEGSAVALLLAASDLQKEPAGTYLIVPLLVAALQGGRKRLMWALVFEIFSLAAVPLAQLRPFDVDPTLDGAVPWLVIGSGIGLLGSAFHQIVAGHESDDRGRYIEAQKLLHELLDVSRRLSSGLDPVVLSSRLLHECVSWVGEGSGQLLVRTEGGVFERLARLGDALPGEPAADPVVLMCWTSGEVARSAPKEADVDAGSLLSTEAAPEDSECGDLVRWAFPLRVGQRMLGVLILDTSRRLKSRHLEYLQDMLDERALALDTALLFDEIRRLATTEERHRLAREIHDGVAQEIASLGYLVDDLAVISDEERAARVVDLRHGLTRVIDDLRLSIFELRSEVNRSTGLGLVLSEYLREVGLRSAMAVYLSIDETADRLVPGVEEELLRIVQEAVTNARRHADAENLWVTCKIQPPGVELVVDDDGKGFTGSREGGYGLSIMRERAERIGASFSISNRPGGGTRISITVAGLEDASEHFDELTAVWREQAPAQRTKEISHG